MSKHFSANQYESAFIPGKLQNWEVPEGFQPVKGYAIQRPRKLEGCPAVIANDRGHLLPTAKRTSDNPWGNYVGTWDLPKRIPGLHVSNKTGRTEQSCKKLTSDAEEASRVLSGKDKNVKQQSTKTEVCELVEQRGSGANAPASKMMPQESGLDQQEYAGMMDAQEPATNTNLSPAPSAYGHSPYPAAAKHSPNPRTPSVISALGQSPVPEKALSPALSACLSPPLQSSRTPSIAARSPPLLTPTSPYAPLPEDQEEI